MVKTQQKAIWENDRLNVQKKILWFCYRNDFLQHKVKKTFIFLVFAELDYTANLFSMMNSPRAP